MFCCVQFLTISHKTKETTKDISMLSRFWYCLPVFWVCRADKTTLFDWEATGGAGGGGSSGAAGTEGAESPVAALDSDSGLPFAADWGWDLALSSANASQNALCVMKLSLLQNQNFHKPQIPKIIVRKKTVKVTKRGVKTLKTKFHNRIYTLWYRKSWSELSNPIEPHIS